MDIFSHSRISGLTPRKWGNSEIVNFKIDRPDIVKQIVDIEEIDHAESKSGLTYSFTAILAPFVEN